MAKPKSASDCGMSEFWKVRITLPGSIIHAATREEPIVHCANGRVSHVTMDLIEGTNHGDSIGFIDWPAVLAVTWRKAVEE